MGGAAAKMAKVRESSPFRRRPSSATRAEDSLPGAVVEQPGGAAGHGVGAAARPTSAQLKGRPPLAQARGGQEGGPSHMPFDPPVPISRPMPAVSAFSTAHVGLSVNIGVDDAAPRAMSVDGDGQSKSTATGGPTRAGDSRPTSSLAPSDRGSVYMASEAGLEPPDALSAWAIPLGSRERELHGDRGGGEEGWAGAAVTNRETPSPVRQEQESHGGAPAATLDTHTSGEDLTPNDGSLTSRAQSHRGEASERDDDDDDGMVAVDLERNLVSEDAAQAEGFGAEVGIECQNGVQAERWRAIHVEAPRADVLQPLAAAAPGAESSHAPCSASQRHRAEPQSPGHQEQPAGRNMGLEWAQIIVAVAGRGSRGGANVQTLANVHTQKCKVDLGWGQALRRLSFETPDLPLLLPVLYPGNLVAQKKQDTAWKEFVTGEACRICLDCPRALQDSARQRKVKHVDEQAPISAMALEAGEAVAFRVLFHPFQAAPAHGGEGDAPEVIDGAVVALVGAVKRAPQVMSA